MQIIDAEPSVIAELKDEGTLLSEKSYPHFKITALRHPTLGKLILVEDRKGRGAVIETEQ